MSTTESEDKSVQQDDPVNSPLPSQDVSQTYVQAHVISEDEDDITTIA